MHISPNTKMSISKFTLYLSIFIYTFSITPTFSSELCNPSDKIALLQIKKSFGNPDILSSWTNNTDCCKDWNLVECDGNTNRINSLKIYDGQLSGEIPSVVGDLTYLETLVFKKLSNLTGTIPNIIGNLTYLQTVRLSWTNLSGSIPSFLSQLKNLNYLDLSRNKLHGSIPPSLSLLTNLNTLRLDRNQLTGSIPDSFGSFTQSNIYIYLSHNKLTGPIPISLGNVNFSVIDFSHNQLRGDATFLFGKNKILQQIYLSRNLLEFDLLDLEFNSFLNSIDLSHNRIYGAIPPSLADLAQLQHFNVSFNQLCGEIPSGGQLGKFDKYSYLHNRCLCGASLYPCL